MKCILLNKQIEKKYTKKTIIENYTKNFNYNDSDSTPFCNECLSIIKAKNLKWPDYDISMLKRIQLMLLYKLMEKKGV